MRLLAALMLAAAVAAGLNGCAGAIDFGPAKAPTPGAVTGADHILLTVADLDRSLHFYRDVLGMRVELRSLHFAMLRAGSFGVIISSKPWEFEKKGEPKGIGMIPHFTTPDMEQFSARMKEHGIPWLRGPVRESFGIEAFIADPDGYQLAILAPLKPAAGGAAPEKSQN
jgi:catechol 2,3-dioxygenase-like lactoylglutathione lyase family enzyme